VSCTSPTACIAVGSSINNSEDDVMLVEKWNGKTWAIQSTPGPAGVSDTYLSAVSCSSSTACVAVGGDSNGALVERLNGSAWTLQSTPSPADASLTGVSCSSVSACTLIGYAFDVEAFAETWNGSSWTVTSLPTPAGASSLETSGVFCTSAAACSAVGFYNNSQSVTVPLAERWYGGSWTIQSMPSPGSSTYDPLFGVSCGSATACIAVGSSINGSGVTLVEKWNGSVWSIQNTPNPVGGQGSELSGVWCTTATACTAVGDSYNVASAYDLTLAEAEGG
jgi:hypothetical protein